MLNLNFLKAEISRQMANESLRFDVESVEEAMEEIEKAAEYISDVYHAAKFEAAAVEQWIQDVTASPDNFLVKYDRNEFIAERLSEWNGHQMPSEAVEDLLFAFSSDAELFQIFTNEVKRRATEKRREMMEAEIEIGKQISKESE